MRTLEPRKEANLILLLPHEEATKKGMSLISFYLKENDKESLKIIKQVFGISLYTYYCNLIIERIQDSL